jgi:hypothetical protein
VTFNKPRDTTVTPILPTDGDVFFLATFRPFTKADKYSFKTKAAQASNELAKSRLDNIYVVPNPYVVANAIEPSQLLPGQLRGERRLYFENLPQQCNIRIFTMTGELVQELHHSSSLDNGREYWNLLNRDGLGVAYGIYIAHIDAPEIGSKILKFAIIK